MFKKLKEVIIMVYGYGRVSTKGQAKEGNSLEAQERERILKEHGAEVIYIDSFTGTKIKDHNLISCCTNYSLAIRWW